MIHVGDALTVLQTMPAESVQCVVSSPPYWGLRDYGTATWDGGDADCDHVDRAARHDVGPDALARRAAQYHTGQGAGSAVTKLQFRDLCGKCGATRIDSQLGLEPTPEEYVANLVKVFREVRRVMRRDATLWLNLGDSYASQGCERRYGSHDGATGRGEAPGPRINAPGLKPKDLVGIPWRVAFALQADGWYLRSDIIWSKPNPMPESVTDRPTKSHEYLFLLTRSATYYYDADAIAETSTGLDAGNKRRGVNPASLVGGSDIGYGFPYQANGYRNKRTVWTISTQPYADAHFATFPEALVEPCILAGSRPGDTVLDPFAGSGTTLAVAKRLDRDYIGIELNPAYAALAEKRLEKSARQIALDMSA